MQKTSLSHPGIFSLGNGSSFTVTFLQDNQRVSKDLQTVLWSSKAECKENRLYRIFSGWLQAEWCGTGEGECIGEKGAVPFIGTSFESLK